jgi:formate dehydrogenase iron-sulfur subunit
MNFGEREAMLKLGAERLAKVRKEYPKAMLLDPDDVNVIFLVTEDRKLYHEYAERRPLPVPPGMDRQRFLATLAKPLKAMFG